MVLHRLRLVPLGGLLLLFSHQVVPSSVIPKDHYLPEFAQTHGASY